ncbi:endocuticle structural glycoprotein SgAbd-3-like [Amyelois transitella]|uniref:endocuticle structural glycoprotein SgAbd-3-like n=1 Tax=Amyelois transitella TaxID=680683 RepID=UPI00298FF8E5|nr:endocuticle structural glycoprotein SgAbd-3-like [Amyelois transitella]
MVQFIILTLASIAAAAKLENVYLPPHSSSSSGGDAGLQTPFEPQDFSSRATQGNLASSASQVELVKYDNQIDEQGYHYAYETSDGTKVEQDGRVIPGPVPEEGSLQVAGSYSYIGDDGQTYSVTYVADENGFRAEGAHLPTPPPIPEAILKSLQLTDSSRAHYDSKKSSYDADAGY